MRIVILREQKSSWRWISTRQISPEIKYWWYKILWEFLFCVNKQSFSYLNQPHLRWNCDNPGYGELQSPATGLFAFIKEMVQHSKQLENALLSAWLGQPSIVHYQVRIQFSVVSSNGEAAGGEIVALDQLHPWHEFSDANVKSVVLRRKRKKRTSVKLHKFRILQHF